MEKEVNHNKRFFEIVGVILLIIIVSLYFLTPLGELFTNPDRIKQAITSFGILAPLALVMLQIIQVILSVFFPGQILSIAGGYIFGWLHGTFLNIIGTMIGSVLVFYLSRKLGRGFVESHVNRKDLRHIDAFFNKRGFVAIVIARMIPFFPNDAVSFSLGLTDISYRKYIWASLIGFIPAMLVLNVFGNELSKGLLNLSTIILFVVLTLLAVFYCYRHKLKVLLLREIREVEKEKEEVEERIHLKIIVSPKPRTR